MRPQIWIGDVVRALEVARSEDEQIEVLRVLGFTTAAGTFVDDDEPDPAPPPQIDPPSEDGGRAPHRPDHDPTDPEPDPDEEPADPSTTLAELPLLRPLRTETTGPVPDPIERLAPPTNERTVRPHLPLLVPHWTSAIIRAALTQPVDEGPIDIDALIEMLARGRPVIQLPRRPVRTLRYGVQVLVDRGSCMQPFRRDQNHLVAQIRSVVGRELVDVGYFSDAPQRGTGPGSRWTRTDYTAPTGGQRILLLSDLGLGGPPYVHGRSTPEEWEEFIALVTRAGCQPVALTPYPPTRWPFWMTALLPLVSWDRTTTTGQISARMP
ncbi:hypothetical protein ABZ348_15255 [Streptomyces sp. NPDC005963]|uniref:hypothetical protein n=1 Tax=Streptomyces sp. NPDC005963 TaxID=3156721 RepID=UPI0033CD24E4